MKLLSFFLVSALFVCISMSSLTAMDCSLEFSGDNAFPLRDGKVACIFDRDGFIRIYDTDSGCLVRELFAFDNRNCEIFQLEDQSIVSLSLDHGIIRCWDWPTGDLFEEFNCCGCYKKISATLRLEDRIFALALVNAPIKIIDVKDPASFQDFKKFCGNVTSITARQNGDLAVGTEWGDIFIFDRKTGETSLLMHSDSGPIQDLFFMGDNGAYLYATSNSTVEYSGIKREFGVIQRWSPFITSQDYGQVFELSEIINTHFLTARLANGFFATTSGREMITIWNLETGKCLRHLYNDQSEKVTALAALEDNFLATGSVSGKIQIWNSETGECIKSFVGHTKSVTKLFLIGKNKFVSVADDEKIKIWCVNKGLPIS